jgi:hypothetical protein
MGESGPCTLIPISSCRGRSVPIVESNMTIKAVHPAIRFSLLSVLVTLLFAGQLTAHPHETAPPTTRQPGQKRIPMRITRPPRVAPDNQTEPLEVGSVPAIDASEQVTLKVKVVDEETAELLPHRVHVEDADGNYYPPEGHFDIEPAAWNTNNVSYEPDTINEGYDWAMIPNGEFKVRVRARDSIQMKFAHGLEYPITNVSLDLAEMAGKTIEKIVSLKRGINMRGAGWMSADTHVHNLTPLGAIRQMPVEAIDYVNLMFIGPRHPLYRRDFLIGKPADVSTDDHIIYLSQEVRDANQGHMTLLGMKTPITPIRVYTGVEQVIRLAPLPNEPLNWEVYDHLHAEGGLAYHAHYLYWPGWGSPVGAGLNKLDGLEWLQTDIASRGDRTRQNIEVPGYGRRAAGRMWYDMLNCGAKLPIVGGTDKMNAGRVIGGSCRTYAKVPEWTHQGFLAGLRTGETFVTNGPMLHLQANDMPIGSELTFHGAGPFTVQVKTGCFTERPVKYFEIVVNGDVVAQVDVATNRKTVEISKKISFSSSGWLAVRARHDKSDPDNWHHTFTAAHSSPIYVTINDQLPANKESADYMVARMDATLQWAEADALWSSNENRRKAISSFRQAKRFYETASERAK